MTTIFTPGNVLEIIEKVESRVNSYWNFYTLVVLATVGWLMSGKSAISVALAAAMTAGLTGFFLANLGSIRAATRRILALEDELAALTRENRFAGEMLPANLSRPAMPGRLSGSYALHLVVDLAVLVAVWSKVFE